MKQETLSGSSINWATCKSAPRSRQITMPAPHRPPLSFLQAGCPSCRPTNSVKALKALNPMYTHWRFSEKHCSTQLQHVSHHTNMRDAARRAGPSAELTTSRGTISSPELLISTRVQLINARFTDSLPLLHFSHSAQHFINRYVHRYHHHAMHTAVPSFYSDGQKLTES